MEGRRRACLLRRLARLTSAAKTRSLDPVGSLAALGNILSWAVVPVLLRDLIHDLDGWTANGIRYPFAALLYWPVLVGAARSGKLTRRLLLLSLGPAVPAFLGQVFWGLAPYYLEAGAMAFLVKLSIVWSAVFALILFRAERALLRSTAFYIGCVLSVGGSLAIAMAGGSLAADVSWQGLGIMLLNTFFFGLYAVAVRYFMAGVPSHLAFGVVCQYVAFGTIVLMFVQGDVGVIPELSGEAWGKLCLSSLLGVGISHVLYYIAIQRLGATISSALHFLTPFLTAAFAYMILGERLTWGQCLAGVVLLAGGAFLLRSQTVIGREDLTKESTS